MSSSAIKPTSRDVQGPRLLTVRETAKRVGMGERAIRRAIERGELNLYRLPATWPRLRWTDVELWIQSFKVVTNPRASARVREICSR